VFDSGTTRGLFDPLDRVYWASDAFATPMPVPVRDVAALDLVFWAEGIHTFDQYISPWLDLVDDARYQRASTASTACNRTRSSAATPR
jgi:hypothetical protein